MIFLFFLLFLSHVLFVHETIVIIPTKDFQYFKVFVQPDKIIQMVVSVSYVGQDTVWEGNLVAQQGVGQKGQARLWSARDSHHWV